MENLTEEQIKRIESEYESIISEGLCDDWEDESLEDKYEAIWQYYDCAGFDLKTEDDFWKLLGM